MISEIRENIETSDYLTSLFKSLKAIQMAVSKEDENVPSVESMLQRQAQNRKKQMESMQKAGSLSEAARREGNRVVRFMETARKQLCLKEYHTEQEAFMVVKEEFKQELDEVKRETQRIGKRLDNLFTFVENAFVEGNEMLILVTELTVNHSSSRYISQFGCDAYQRHNESLMLSERQSLLKEEVEALEL